MIPIEFDQRSCFIKLVCLPLTAQGCFNYSLKQTNVHVNHLRWRIQVVLDSKWLSVVIKKDIYFLNIPFLVPYCIWLMWFRRSLSSVWEQFHFDCRLNTQYEVIQWVCDRMLRCWEGQLFSLSSTSEKHDVWTLRC